MDNRNYLVYAIVTILFIVYLFHRAGVTRDPSHYFEQCSVQDEIISIY